MANHILIASHAHLASGLQSSLQLLSGLGDNVTTIDAYVDGNDNYTDQIDAFIKGVNGDPAVIFTDLEGGSVNQKVMLAAADHPNITVVTQTNLAVVMTAVLSTDPLTEDNLRKLVGECQVKIVSAANAESSDTGDDDF
ncbi:PTS fructose transporter subunit IIA [Lacticaseibacillus pabuli]|uniref:PTS fructose transporter subunit IIA n=1 Tax=Lacticaseibacillus pabuli TaxID=3025672 RepID=A0ABY7WSJ4_9LACO|nr:PTS fructose transporter subunit IIA [Lacticaseibacillus sp. KACC 23028]WDF82388.1 PTS fructose transporter subunit IIA [Lacticaseibacillus sp. KACC 23028]